MALFFAFLFLLVRNKNLRIQHLLNICRYTEESVFVDFDKQRKRYSMAVVCALPFIKTDGFFIY
jgi:hypothetical protein